MFKDESTCIYRKTVGGAGIWLAAFAIIALVYGILFSIVLYFDIRNYPNFLISEIVFHKGAINSLGNMPEVIAGVLGIAITVVAIIVELAANRYTSKVTDLFVKNWTNLAVLGFFVISCLLCVWISIIGDTDLFVPVVGRTVTFVVISLCLLLLLPYFVFVFNFLNPHNVIEKMGATAYRAVSQAKGTRRFNISRVKKQSVTGIEQLTDVALNAIEHKDKGICMHAVDALGRMVRDYLLLKPKMPDEWYKMDLSLQENPDFISMQTDVLNDIEKRRYWFEMKILRQYQMLYGDALNRMRDINYLIAINTRKLFECASESKCPEVSDLAQKFMNTYLRATINAKDVRTAYNILNQFRLTAEYSLKTKDYNATVETAKRFQYYGQLAFNLKLPFIMETCAYDLCTINEKAFDLNVPCRGELLAIFLELDKEGGEDHKLEASLRGVRKAQIKLATYYLTNSDEQSARLIYEDMKYELSGRLLSIQKELLSIETSDFWEVSDRGVNFDYLEPKRKLALNTFFEWFEERQSMLPVEQRKNYPNKQP